jgi:hypothetical protein
VGRWYKATVTAYNETTGAHTVEYLVRQSLTTMLAWSPACGVVCSQQCFTLHRLVHLQGYEGVDYVMYLSLSHIHLGSSSLEKGHRCSHLVSAHCQRCSWTVEGVEPMQKQGRWQRLARTLVMGATRMPGVQGVGGSGQVKPRPAPQAPSLPASSTCAQETQ